MQPENRRAFKHIEEEVRAYDPLETVQPDFNDEPLVGELEHDIVRIDEMLATDQTLNGHERRKLYEMGCNLRLDWLYAKHGGQNAETSDFLAKAKEAESFFGQAMQNAERHKRHHPQTLWGLKVKQFDLTSVVLNRYAKESQTTQKGTETGEKMWLASENASKRVLGGSVELMKEMSAVAEGGSDLAQDARGSLYELMLLTYSRLKVFEHEAFATTLVRSALSREDRPWNGHATPLRSFDIVIQRSGEDPQLIQAKNYFNTDSYAAPIQKVQDTHFAQTLADLPTYLRDFAIVVANPSDERMAERLNLAANRLENAFDAQLEPVRALAYA